MFYYESLLKGKNDKAYKALKEEYDIAYLDLSTNQSLMTMALQLVNRPNDIDEIYKEINMDGINLENCSRCGYRYYLKGLADIEQKKYKQVIDELLNITKIIENGYLKKPLIMAFVRSGDYKALNEQFNLWELSMDKNELLNLYLFTGKEFLLANENSNAKIYFDKTINNSSSNSLSLDVACAYYYNQDYKTAQVLLEKLNTINPKDIDILVELAISNYKNGNKQEAEQNIKSLEALRTEFQFGDLDYGLAQYYASIDDRENTFNYLRKAVASGKWFTPTTFQNDTHFKNYLDTQEFKAILNYWNKIL
jgi:hypothetical protein